MKVPSGLDCNGRSAYPQVHPRKVVTHLCDVITIAGVTAAKLAFRTGSPALDSSILKQRTRTPQSGAHCNRLPVCICAQVGLCRVVTHVTYSQPDEANGTDAAVWVAMPPASHITIGRENAVCVMYES